MKLYVCWTTKDLPLPPRRHVCNIAHEALLEAGYEPEVTHALSYGGVPDAVQTPARKRVKAKTGSSWVPALETDDGEWVSGSQEIVDWAATHPAAATA